MGKDKKVDTRNKEAVAFIEKHKGEKNLTCYNCEKELPKFKFAFVPERDGGLACWDCHRLIERKEREVARAEKEIKVEEAKLADDKKKSEEVEATVEKVKGKKEKE